MRSLILAVLQNHSFISNLFRIARSSVDLEYITSVLQYILASLSIDASVKTEERSERLVRSTLTHLGRQRLVCQYASDRRHATTVDTVAKREAQLAQIGR